MLGTGNKQGRFFRGAAAGTTSWPDMLSAVPGIVTLASRRGEVRVDAVSSALPR